MNTLKLANYKIGHVIGKGGFGTVYSAVRIEDNLPVAIKEIPAQSITQWAKIKNCKGKKRTVPLEIELLSKMDGVSGIIKLIEWLEVNQTVKHYVNTSLGDTSSIDEYLKDDDSNPISTVAFLLILERPDHFVDLFDYVAARHKLKEHVVKKFFKDIFFAVKNCFDRGIVHRDIKDENILLELDPKNEVVKLILIDFGSGSYMRKTDFVDFQGTKEFAPPEFFKHRRYNGEMLTVWSLGVLLFSMLCGNVPWQHERDILNANESDIWFPSNVNVSKSCADLIKWCLTRDLTRRAKLQDIYNHEWMN
jgi:proto-oncogene serine/threonine-protein kinase Pim-1